MKAILLSAIALVVISATVVPTVSAHALDLSGQKKRSVTPRAFKFAKASDKAAVAHLGDGRRKSENQTVDRATGLADSVFASYSFLTLAVQKCSYDSDWTLHGLWPSTSSSEGPSYCTKVPFVQSQIQSLWSEIEQYWPTCTWAHTSETTFLSHEWEKHGTCFGTSEYTFFSDALEIFLNGDWRSKCEGEDKECKVTVQPPSA